MPDVDAWGKAQRRAANRATVVDSGGKAELRDAVVSPAMLIGLAMPLERPTVLELTSAPANPVERIDAIDVLRGVALFGAMAINVITEFRVSIFEQLLPAANSASRLIALC